MFLIRFPASLVIICLPIKKLSADIEKEIKAAAKNSIAERIGPEKDAEMVLLNGYTGRTITDYATKIVVDCIIAGSHRPGMKDFSLAQLPHVSCVTRLAQYMFSVNKALLITLP
jgi:hypothetical protein